MLPLITASVNHVLRRNSWALNRLRAHAGKTVAVECPPVTLALVIQEHGEVADAPSAPPDVSIQLSPGVMLRILARDEAVWQHIGMQGDAEFAAAILHVWRNLRWEFEEDLARVIGDVAAHRVARTATALDQWRAQSFEHLARAAAEYWTEEQPLIARAHDIGEFNREVDRLRDDVARAEKRVALLAAGQSLPPAG